LKNICYFQCRFIQFLINNLLNYICTCKGINQCIDGTHNCTAKENCISTPNGFECQPRQIVSMAPENLIKPKKKQNCGVGYAYSLYEQKCKGKSPQWHKKKTNKNILILETSTKFKFEPALENYKTIKKKFKKKSKLPYKTILFKDFYKDKILTFQNFLKFALQFMEYNENLTIFTSYT